MISADYDRFVALLRELAVTYSRKLTDEQVALYWDALKDRPFEDVERRARDHVRKSKFWPKPVEFRPVEAKRERVESDPKREAEWTAMVAENERNWNERIEREGAVGKLKLAGALLARYTIDANHPGQAERMAWLRGRMAELIVEAGHARVYDDSNLASDVRQVFGQDGYVRLRDRAGAAA